MAGFSEHDVEHLKDRLDAALARGGRDTWETSFLRDMRSRFQRDGIRTRLTDKQSRKLYEVLDRSVGRRLAVPYETRNRYHRQPRSLLSKGARRFSWRLRRDLTVLALIIIAGSLYTIAKGLFPTTGVQVSAIATSEVYPPTKINGSIRVIDGDTVEVAGEHFRLIGLNTPETFEPRCDAEKELGERAKARLKELLSGGSAELTRVPCSCPPGTEGTSKCNFGRSCGVLLVNSRDVADTLIGEGLAAEFHCGASSCPPLPRPWCG